MELCVCTFCQCLLVFLLCDVQVVHICSVMLAVVQLHYFCTNVRLQSSIVIRQVRQQVLLPRRCYLT